MADGTCNIGDEIGGATITGLGRRLWPVHDKVFCFIEYRHGDREDAVRLPYGETFDLSADCRKDIEQRIEKWVKNG